MSLCINPNCSNPENSDNTLFCQSCGSELLLAGRYRVRRLLGQGGFAKTFEAIHNSAPKVLKVLTLNDPKAIELFQQEARVLQQLNRPGIPNGEEYLAFYPRNSQTPVHCLVMQYIEGMNLDEYIKERQLRPIDQKLAVEWLIQLVNILGEVHSQNFFHRDIKPSNIMLQPDGQLALIDFGTVREITETVVNSGGGVTKISSVGFTPPEQENGLAVKQSDFFALGRTFVYLLTGKMPNDPELYDSFNNKLNWRSCTVDVSSELAGLIDELMAPAASGRPADTGVILQRLEDIKGGRIISRKKDEYPEKKEAGELENTVISATVYASFWERFGAYSLDMIILAIAAVVLGGISGIPLISSVGYDTAESFLYGAILAGMGVFFGGLCLPVLTLMLVAYLDNNFLSQEDNLIIGFILLGMVLNWLYFTVLESSRKQSTFGKKSSRIMVTNLRGDRISFIRANIRYWSKILSTLIVFGFLMAGMTDKQQALHDLIARCLVIKKN